MSEPPPEAPAGEGPSFTAARPLDGEPPFAARRRPDLVLLPGMLGDAEGWDAVAGRLSAHARLQVGRIDLDDSIADLAEGVLAAAPEEFALAGHSLGGIVALEVARRAPARVRRLALLNSSGRAPTPSQRETWSRWDARTAAGEFDVVAAELAVATLPASRSDLTGLNERMAHRVGAEGFRRQLAAQQSRTDLLATLTAVTAPTLVLSGDLDEVSPPTLQAELAEGITASRHVTLTGVGHMSMLEDPDGVARALAAWLQPIPR